MSLPYIPNATVQYNKWNRVEIIMNDGYVFYDKDNYSHLTDEYGNPREPLPEEISYFRYGVFSPATDFDNRIVVVPETDVPENQIFGEGDNHETV
jgi:hypothetical protein